MSLHVGALDQRITIEQRDSGVDSLGQESLSWSTVATVWAAAEPLRGRELFAAGQAQSQVDVKFRIRYRAGLTPAMRVQWRDVPHDIISVIEWRGQQHIMELLCSTGARDGR